MKHVPAVRQTRFTQCFVYQFKHLSKRSSWEARLLEGTLGSLLFLFGFFWYFRIKWSFGNGSTRQNVEWNWSRSFRLKENVAATNNLQSLRSYAVASLRPIVSVTWPKITTNTCRQLPPSEIFRYFGQKWEFRPIMKMHVLTEIPHFRPKAAIFRCWPIDKKCSVDRRPIVAEPITHFCPTILSCC